MVIWQPLAAAHMEHRGITAAMCAEALADENCVAFEPDYASKSGDSVRYVGWSATYGDLLTVLTFVEDGVEFGSTAWKTNRERDLRAYWEGKQ